MTPSDLPEIFLVDGLWMDRRIPNFQVPRLNGFFPRAFRKIKFWEEILIIKKLAFEIKISQCTNMTAKLHFLLMSIYNGRSYGKL